MMMIDGCTPAKVTALAGFSSFLSYFSFPHDLASEAKRKVYYLRTSRPSVPRG